jgi:HEAT repeat protein
MAAAKVNVAELVSQMPETDKEIQARKDAEQQAQQAPQQPVDPNAKPKEKPKPDRWGAASKFTGPDPVLANKLFEQAFEGGRGALDDLVKLVRDPLDPEFKNYKAEYFLHGLGIYASTPGREARQKQVAQALASYLGNTKLSGHVRGFLIRELRVIGGSDAAKALAKLLNDEQFCADAAAALVSLGDAGPLRDSLGRAKGKCRLTLAQSVGVLRDEKSAKPLRSLLNDPEQDVRLTAAWSLARIGDEQSIDALLKLASGNGWERIKGTQAVVLLAETLSTKGKRDDARRIYLHLRNTRNDPAEAYLRELADKALAAPNLG